MRPHRFALGAGCALLIAGCASHAPRDHGATAGRAAPGGGYYENDGPPANPDIDLSQIPNAVPKKEPRSQYGNPASYTALGKTYHVLDSAAGFTQIGKASWYGRQFEGQRTSSGEPYNMFKMTAAHKRLPIPCYVRVTNLDNGRHTIVRINDRGPFHTGRIIDLSYVAARRLGIVATGSAPVRIRTVAPNTRLAKRQPHEPPSTLHRSIEASGNAGAPPTTRADNATRIARSVDTPTVTATTEPSIRDDHEGWFLQTGAFGKPRNARRLRARLRADGVNRVVVLAPDSTMPLYRVRIGPFDTPAARAAARRRLTARGFSARTVAQR